MEEERTGVETHLKYFGLGKLLRYLKPFSGAFAGMLFFGTIGGFTDIILPLFQSYAIDHYIANKTLDGIKYFILLFLAVLAAQIVLNTIAVFKASKIEAGVARDMRKDAFEHLQTLSFSFFSKNSVGYIHARVMSDTSRIGSIVSWNLMEGLWTATYLVGAVVYMLICNWKLALIVLAIIPLVCLASVYFQKKLVTLNRFIREINSKITGKFNEGITGAKTIKVLGTEETFINSFTGITEKMKKQAVWSSHYRSMFTSVISFAASISLAFVLWRGGIITRDGVMAIGTLSVFMTYARGMINPIQWMVRTLSDLISVQVNIERFTSLMEAESDVADSPEVVAKYGDNFIPKQENWEPMHGEIELKDVSFKYPDGDAYIIEHFHLKVPQGTTVALVGETGAGKSTLVNLLCRFFEPTSGQVLIDGRDVRERSQLWLHRNIGYVLQTPHLFSGTVLENLRYGKPEATMEQIMEAVKLVSADGIIDRMENGYNSDIGEGGDMLSTGEKQLISFARAVLADPKLFVLDEATSSVDTMTEMLIQQATATLMQGRTSFIVAHRLSTIRNADIILVIENGKIVERGSHIELMNKRGSYYALYTKQFSHVQTELSLTHPSTEETIFA